MPRICPAEFVTYFTTPTDLPIAHYV